MTSNRKAAEEFVARWRGHGNEEQDKQKFWIGLFQDVLGLEDALDRLEFEKPVVNSSGSKNPGFIDVLIPTAKAIVEQKGAGVDLDKPELRQGSMVTPAEQALRYAQGMPLNESPRYVIACNFKEFRTYDRVTDPLCTKPLFDLALEDLPKNLAALDFLKGTGEAPSSLQQAVSVKAGQIMGEVHNLLAAQYHDPDSSESHHALSVICTRLMFLMYCEDAVGIKLVAASAFHDYLQHYPAEDLRGALKRLFVWLDTKPEDRDEYAEGPIIAFPYMDGGLFHEQVEVPPITEEIKQLLVVDGCQEFDWSNVDPTVFGSIFEGALSHDARRSGGMHYTSPENIHRVIDPLFYDGLKQELADAMARSEVGGARTRALKAFQDKLGSLTFLDPACGSGNFLTETYKCLRRLENKVFFELAKDDQSTIIFEDVEASPVKVRLDHFHGIEINDYACCVARTALWIAEKQADEDTSEIIMRGYDELPLTDYGGIVEGNALRMDWNEVVPASECDYVMGNPPFIGYSNLDKGQNENRASIFGKVKVLDYVACWYKKASDYIRDTHARCAFVSTNSVCQGQQVEPLWRPLFEDGIQIDFAWSTFVWNSEATDEAHVHVVIVGFSREDVRPKRIYSADGAREVDHINAYLAPAADTFVTRRAEPICHVPEMIAGGKPTDGGNLLLTQEERDDLVRREPAAEKWIRPFSMGAEYINGIPRYCLWLVGIEPSELRSMPQVAARVDAVREFRLASSKAATRKKAEEPWLFDEVRPPKGKGYIAIPKVSSGRRDYIPMGFVTDGMIPGDKLFYIDSGGLYELGILESKMHNAWMRMVAGRLKSDYSYSNTIVYNNFVWPDATGDQRSKVEACAQGVLDARAAHPGQSLADLYDPKYIPSDLRAAHHALDAAVEAAYGVDFGGDEEKIIAHLFKLYAEKTKGE